MKNQKICLCCLLALFLLLGACAPMEPNNISSPHKSTSTPISKPAISAQDSQPESSSAPSSELSLPGEASPKRESLRNSIDDVGEIIFQPTDLRLVSTWEEAGLADIEKFDVYFNEGVLLITVEVINKSFPLEEAENRGGFLINSLQLVCTDVLSGKVDEHSEGAIPAHYPSYCSTPGGSTHEYFCYALPDIGSNNSVTLGWDLRSEEVELLKNGEMNLVWATAPMSYGVPEECALKLLPEEISEGE